MCRSGHTEPSVGSQITPGAKHWITHHIGVCVCEEFMKTRARVYIYLLGLAVILADAPTK